MFLLPLKVFIVSKLNGKKEKVKLGNETGSPIAVERRNRITQLAGQQGSVRVSELSELFQVSEVTIRSDLDVLTRQGMLVRGRGGAVRNENSGLFIAYAQRASVNLDAKRRIGSIAATLVTSGETIIMDAGTTVMEMAKSLNVDLAVTVVTNALNVATQVGALPNAHVIVLGGSLVRETLSTLGPHSERDLSEIAVQKVFLGANAMDAKFGITDTQAELARSKRFLAQTGRQVILLADSSKWGRASFAKVLPLSDIHVLITDNDLPQEAQAIIRDIGVKLICV